MMHLSKLTLLNSSSFIYSSMLLVFSILSFFASLKFYLQDLVIFIEWEIYFVASINIVYTILLDWMSLSFISVVMFISSMVLVYSFSYLHGDLNFNRFIILVYLFVLSMIFMVMSPNMVSILLGWDGLGLVSYALVIYYQNTKSASAGMITVLSNRIGDVAILVSISWMFNFGSWDFFYLQEVFSSKDLFLVSSLVILAAMTKSAQIPFSAWLPAAMAAPTPVSSLVHSSTLVTAGVYLLIRFNEVLGVNFFLLLVATITLLMSGWGANFEFDLKKIIALSTLSQLGMMMLVLSIGLYELAYFHLISHALFKSLLFLCAGFFIHSNLDCQDIRFMGKIYLSFPLTNLYFVGSSLSLCGFPFLAGFYSKDLILESFFFSSLNFFIYFMLLLGTMFTITYSLRLFYYIYMKSFKNVKTNFSETSSLLSLVMLLPMSFLFVFSVIVGSWFTWNFTPPLFIYLPLFVKLTVLVSMFLITWFVLTTKGVYELKYYWLKFKFTSIFKWFVGQMWFLAFITPLMPVKILTQGGSAAKFMDSGWLEIFGGQGGMKYIMVLAGVVDKWSFLNFKSFIFMLFLVMIFVSAV
uniref:NADH-ubiquinone oxidoreductase chain 5 n=1 Tax=Friesea gretae TaxID=2779679 RepID=A0A899IJW9_9HEXA|nr:NADH dehydrogenase subunit 5 [Friesea gretae]QSL98427.1 NADH dehydrogenase subunit 5 [Friesea gretae]